MKRELKEQLETLLGRGDVRLPSVEYLLASIGVSLKRIADQSDVEERITSSLEPKVDRIGDKLTFPDGTQVKSDEPVTVRVRVAGDLDRGEILAWIEQRASLDDLTEIAFSVKERIETFRRQP